MNNVDLSNLSYRELCVLLDLVWIDFLYSWVFAQAMNEEREG